MRKLLATLGGGLLSLAAIASPADAAIAPACSGPITLRALAMADGKGTSGWNFAGSKSTPRIGQNAARVATVWHEQGDPLAGAVIVAMQLASPAAAVRAAGDPSVLRHLANGMTVEPWYSPIAESFPIPDAKVFYQATKTTVAVQIVWPFDNYLISEYLITGATDRLTLSVKSKAIIGNAGLFALAIESRELMSCV